MATSPAAGRLPRGRHGLSRHEVEAAQRGRMLLAMAEAMAEVGYASTSVAQVIKRAGVSRETFYQQFASKLDCFMSAFDAAGDALAATLQQALATEGEPLARFDHALSAYLRTLAAQPAQARLFVVEVHAAGPAALERRAAFQARMVDALVALFDLDGPDGRFACEALVAAIAQMVSVALVRRDLDALLALHDPFVDLVRRAVAGP